MRTATERAGAFYRADPAARVPPKVLSPRAKAIWKEIVKAKPPDWFDGGSVGLLADHCETQARLEECWALLRRLPVGSDDARGLMAELRVLRPNFATSSRLLRLTVSAGIERQAAKAGESAPEAQAETLIGGEAAKRFRVIGD
jgi:hypothetical protein